MNSRSIVRKLEGGDRRSIKPALIGDLARFDQKEVRRQVAPMLPRLPWTDRERQRGVAWLVAMGTPLTYTVQDVREVTSSALDKQHPDFGRQAVSAPMQIK